MEDPTAEADAPVLPSPTEQPLTVDQLRPFLTEREWDQVEKGLLRMQASYQAQRAEQAEQALTNAKPQHNGRTTTRKPRVRAAKT